MRQFYRYQDVGLEVLCEDRALVGAIDEIALYHLFVPADAGQQRLLLTLRCVSDLPLPVVPVEAHSYPMQGTGCCLHQVPGGYYVIWKSGLIEVRLDARAIHVFYSEHVWRTPGQVQPDFVYGLMTALQLLLRREGRYLLHAAGLVKDGVGMLLIGKSDTGKSTTTFGLVRQGWRYLTDDVVLLRARDAVVEATSFRKDFGLDADAARFFPEIRTRHTYQMTDPEKWRVDVGALYPGQFSMSCVPRVLLFPEIVPAPKSELVPLRTAEGLHRLVAKNALTAAYEKESVARHFETLKCLAGQAQSYLLRAGQDLGRNPMLAADLLRPLLQRQHAIPDYHAVT